MAIYQVGCSGFHYREWKEIFYPKGTPQKKWFAYYTKHFDTLELNVTFYRFPKKEFLQTWYDAAPHGFCFSVKAPRLITHYKQLRATESMLADFYGTVRETLHEKMGCILFQFPSKISYNPALLERILTSLDPSFRNVVEFRHQSWWQQPVYDQLATKGIIFSGISHPALPDQPIHNTPLLYYRFHGVPDLYSSQYKRKTIERIINQIEAMPSLRKAYIYFNNTAGIGAIRNALYIMRYIRQTEAKL